MQFDLKSILENKKLRQIKNAFWKIEPYLSKALFFLSIALFFIQNLILKLNYSLIFNPEFQGNTGIFGSLVLLGIFFGMFVVFPLYPYFKLIHNELGPKSTHAYEIFVSLSLLITNYILNVIKSPEYYGYIFFFGSMSICLFGLIFVSSNEEKIEKLIDEAINPSKTYNTIIDYLRNQLKEILKLIEHTQNEITSLLKTSNHTDSKKIYTLLDKKTELIENYIFLKKKIEKIHAFYEENKKEYSSIEIYSNNFSECNEELILRGKLYNSDKNIVSYFMIGFILIFLGCSIIFLTYFGTPPNAPVWTSFILIPSGLMLWIYGNRYRKRVLYNADQLKNIIMSQISTNIPNQEKSHTLTV